MPETASSLYIIANYGVMRGHPSPDCEWTLKEKFQAAKNAGFDGMMGPADSEFVDLIAKHGFKHFGGCDIGSEDQIEPKLTAFKNVGVKYVNVQMADHDTTLEEALPLAVALIEASDQLGLSAHIEMHRDTCTETPEKLYALADAYQEKTGDLMPICWDHSHFAVVKHIRPEHYSERMLIRPELIQNSVLFHCRPFNGHHCQIPVTDGKGNLIPEFLNWIAFIEDLFSVWQSGPQRDGQLWVVPELISLLSGYNLSILPPAWDDEIVCRGELLKAWDRARLH